MNPLAILTNTPVFLQKILLYSYFKRKGIQVTAGDTTLYEALNKNLGHPIKKSKLTDLNKQQQIKIKRVDDIIDLQEECSYVYSNGIFEKIMIKSWDPKII